MDKYVLTRIQLEQLVDSARRDADRYSTLNVSSKSRARAFRRAMVREFLTNSTVTTQS